jgi:hypothetical protein
MDTLLSFSIGVDLILAPHSSEVIKRAAEMVGTHSGFGLKANGAA